MLDVHPTAFERIHDGFHELFLNLFFCILLMKMRIRIYHEAR